MFVEILHLLYQITQILESQNFLNYIGRFVNLNESDNLLTKLQDAIGRGQSPFTILPSLDVEPEIITITDPDSGIAGRSCCNSYFAMSSLIYNSFLASVICPELFFSALCLEPSGSMYCYDRFPSNIRTEEQEERRQAILAAASGTLEILGNTIARFIQLTNKDSFMSNI